MSTGPAQAPEHPGHRRQRPNPQRPARPDPHPARACPRRAPSGPVLSSTETLATLRDRVELHLQDSGNAKWASADVDEAIEKALEDNTRHSPRLAVPP